MTTREPGGTPLGDRLRAVFLEPGLAIDPLAEAFVVSASRAQHVADVVEPALHAGSWVLCDRFSAATIAYQGHGRGLPLEILDMLAAIATRGRSPDVTFVVDVTVERSRERVAARANERGETVDRLEREGIAFHERVRAGYLALAISDPTFVVLDGERDADDLADEAFARCEVERTRARSE